MMIGSFSTQYYGNTRLTVVWFTWPSQQHMRILRLANINLLRTVRCFQTGDCVIIITLISNGTSFDFVQITGDRTALHITILKSDRTRSSSCIQL